MGRKCSIPNCQSDYYTCKGQISIFKIPNDKELFAKWQEATSRCDIQITTRDFVCEKHFQKDDIIRSWQFHGVKEDYKVPRLKRDAVPTIFPEDAKCKSGNRRKVKTVKSVDCNNTDSQGFTSSSENNYENCKDGNSNLPSSGNLLMNFGKAAECDNSALNSSTLNDSINNKYIDSCLLNIASNSTTLNNINRKEMSSDLKLPFSNEHSILNQEKNSKPTNHNVIHEHGNIKLQQIPNNCVNINLECAVSNTDLQSLCISSTNLVLNPNKNKCAYSDLSSINRNLPESKDDSVHNNLFHAIWNDKIILSLPDKSWACFRVMKNNTKVILFSDVHYIDKKPVFQKQLELKEDKSFLMYVNFRILSENHVSLFTESSTIAEIEELKLILCRFHNTNICRGGPSLEEYDLSKVTVTKRRSYEYDNEYKRWRHKNCNVVTCEENMKCLVCKKLERYFKKAVSRASKKKVATLNLSVGNNLKTYKRQQRNKNYHLKAKVQKLEAKIKMLENNMEVQERRKQKKTKSPTISHNIINSTTVKSFF